ncbi:MAG: hypothetical protein JRJ27_18420 [Deltaproteobacteria bacterium]|nr:hypothetical protein [Deltaproteobacteria bacterium]
MKVRICLLTLFVILVILGCTSKRGIIELHTRPSEADIYLGDAKQGMSPLKFEYDFSQPATLKIERQNYYTEVENLSEAWVVREIRKGNYTKGDFIVQGKNIKAWKVTITRSLQKKEEE